MQNTDVIDLAGDLVVWRNAGTGQCDYVRMAEWVGVVGKYYYCICRIAA